MRLGLNVGYWGSGNDAQSLALARETDRLGYAVCWAAEAYGSDAPTVLAWVAAQTERIDVGSAVMLVIGDDLGAAAVPHDFIDRTSLIGPVGRIRDRLHTYAEAGVTTLTITPGAPTLDRRLAALRSMAQALEASGLAT
jgi:alkanesulfonate monooxygenase SsuD/methylene tetrahydromethanopterin reductase-like flavin-dependent oxidoreductase (luciferase family)